MLGYIYRTDVMPVFDISKYYIFVPLNFGYDCLWNYGKKNSNKTFLFCLINRHLSSFEMRSHINENILKVYYKNTLCCVNFFDFTYWITKEKWMFHFSFVSNSFCILCQGKDKRLSLSISKTKNQTSITCFISDRYIKIRKYVWVKTTCAKKVKGYKYATRFYIQI